MKEITHVYEVRPTQNINKKTILPVMKPRTQQNSLHERSWKGFVVN